MKKIFLFILAAFLWGCSSVPKCGITGSFTGLMNDTLLVFVNELEEGRFKLARRDTIIVQDGHFSYDPRTDSLTELKIFPFENINHSPNSDRINYYPEGYFTLLYVPGEPIRLTAGNEDNATWFEASGSKCSEQLSQLNMRIKDARITRSATRKIVFDRNYTGDKTAYREKLNEASDIVNNNDLNYIRENPNEPLSAYLVASFHEFTKIIQYADSLGKGAMESELGLVLQQKINDINDYNARTEEKKKKEDAQKGMIGKPAPNFTLEDINGNKFSLSTLRGKYVVLDFWGSWCPWCLEAFPGVKKYYADHPGEFEIAGVAFGDKPANWKAAIQKHALPWINVIDLDRSIADTYYITGAPTYFLIDKEGIIVNIPFPHDEIFKQLDELRKKGSL